MARQTHYKPGEHADNNGDVYDDGGFEVPQHLNERSAQVSNDAQNALDSIDGALADNQAIKAGEEGGGLYNASGDSAAKSASAQDLAAAEGNGSGPGKDDLYKHEDAPQRGGIRGWVGKHRRQTIIGSVIGLVTGGGMLVGLPLLGPAEFVQVSHVLQHSSAKGNHDSSSRLGKLYRYGRALKSGNIGETRVGFLGSKVVSTTIKQLGDTGIEFELGPSGAPTKTVFDKSKLETNFPETKGMSEDEFKAFLVDKLSGSGITADQINVSGGKYSIDQYSMDLKSSRLLLKSTVSLMDDGTIVNGVKFREMGKFFNLPSLLHPFERAKAAPENKLSGNLAKKAADDAERAREAAVTDPAEAEAVPAVEETKKAANDFNSTAMKALLFTAGLCFLHAVADAVVTINHYRIVVPSMLRAADLVAAGAQVESGQDLTTSQIGALHDSLIDKNGKTIWDSQGMQALANNGKTDTNLADLPQDYRQAFSGDTTAKTITSWVDSHIPGGEPAVTTLCSPGGMALQGLVTLALSAASAIAEAGSLGSLTPAIVAGWAGIEAGKFAISAVAMHVLQTLVVSKLSDGKLPLDAFSGPLGGNLLAYGSRAAANTVSIASGGIDLGNKAATLFAVDEQQKENQQFRSQGFFARAFNIYDNRSLAGHYVAYLSPNVGQNISRVGSYFTNVGSSLSGVFAAFIPKSYAAQTSSYDWGFGQYGLPDSMLNDPNLADPYQNAQQAATILDSSAGQSYIDRANNCFGVTISKTNADNVWDVIPTKEIDVAQQSYTDANCSDISDPSWRQIIMFVFDTNTIKGAACFQGDNQSCQDLGQTSGATSTSFLRQIHTHTQESVATNSARDKLSPILETVG